MNREQLGVHSSYNLPISQDSLNPNLKNITSRFMNLDSQFRQPTSSGESSATDYTLDLSEPLNNVLSMRLYSIQIPYAWYTVDSQLGTNCFWIKLEWGLGFSGCSFNESQQKNSCSSHKRQR